jgi:folate-dependent phosphoribosylglycinamide formyltransferase PurN
MLKRPGLRVAVLCSTRAPGLTDLVYGDANRGRLYDLVLAVTSDPDCRTLATLDAVRIPVAIHDIRRFYAQRGAARRDLAVRREYDRWTARTLRDVEVDLVVLCGYLHVLTDPMLAAFPQRVINIHDADLTLTGDDGLPRYRGLHATRDALFAGEPETRSSVHVVTAAVDAGPLLVRSGPFPTHPLVADARRLGATDVLNAYAYAQREWMMRTAWGALLGRAVERFTRNEVARDAAILPHELPVLSRGGEGQCNTSA